MTIRCHMPTCSFTQNFWGKTFLERTTVNDALIKIKYNTLNLLLEV